MDNLHDEPLEFEIPTVVDSQIISTRSWKSHQLLKKAFVLLLSVSLLSIILSVLTRLSFRHSYTYYFTTFLFPLFTRVLERKYMFLLCNGLLVLLARKIGLSATFSSPHPKLHEQTESVDIQGKIMIRNNDQDNTFEHAAPADPQYEAEAGTCVQTVGCTSTTTFSTLREQEKDALEECREVHEEGLEESKSIVLGEEGSVDELVLESEEASSNTEELNKKFEEFIRKMKEELRLEAQQQQLITA